MQYKNLKVNGGKSMVKVLGGEDILACEVSMNEGQMEDISEFKYLGLC